MLKIFHLLVIVLMRLLRSLLQFFVKPKRVVVNAFSLYIPVKYTFQVPKMDSLTVKETKLKGIVFLPAFILLSLWLLFYLSCDS